MLISVIVPVYNVEKTLSRCIDSILTQTFTDFELLLIDDGSTDNSGKICEKYAGKDKRIRVFHKKNGGPGLARNLGIEKSCGEWICFCDSDDYVLPNWLYEFSLNINDKNSLIISGFISVFNDERTLYELTSANLESSVEINSFIIDYLEKKYIQGYLWCKCFNKSIIRANNIKFEDFPIWEDVIFIYTYLKYTSHVAVIHPLTYIYFIPDYSKKYTNVDTFECTQEIVANIVAICPNYKEMFGFRRYMREIFRGVVFKYKQYDWKNGRNRLRKYIKLLYIYNYTKGNKLTCILSILPIPLIHLILIIAVIIHNITFFKFNAR